MDFSIYFGILALFVACLIQAGKTAFAPAETRRLHAVGLVCCAGAMFLLCWRAVRLNVEETFVGVVWEGNIPRATSLLRSGANPDWEDGDGTPALASASRANDPRMVELLLRYHASVRGGGFAEALEIARENHYDQICRLLLAAREAESRR